MNHLLSLCICIIVFTSLTHICNLVQPLDAKLKKENIFDDFNECRKYLNNISHYDGRIFIFTQRAHDNILTYYTKFSAIGGNGVGSHDSLNYFYIEKKRLSIKDWHILASIYNIKYFVVQKKIKHSHFKEIWHSQNKTYFVYELEVERHNYFELYAKGNEFTGMPQNQQLRKTIFQWLSSYEPVLKIQHSLNFRQKMIPYSFNRNAKPRLILQKRQKLQSPTITTEGFLYHLDLYNNKEIQVKVSKEHKNINTWQIYLPQTSKVQSVQNKFSLKEETQFILSAKPLGEIVETNTDFSQGTYSAKVVLEQPAFLVLKMTYHPFWSVEVDGKTQNVLYMLPAFTGVSLSPGKHNIIFRYTYPTYGLYSFFGLFIFFYRKKLCIKL